MEQQGGDAACWAHLVPAGSLDPAQARHLADEGWTTVAGVLGPTEAAALAAKADSLLADAAAAGDLRPGDKAVAGTRHLVELEDRLPEVLDVLAHPTLRAVVEALVGPDARPGGVHLRSPQPGHGGQRLHADHQPLAGVGPAQVATCILALVDVTEENGATRVVPGSHLRPDLQRRASRGDLDSLPGERLLTGPAGTAFVFSGHLLHSGTPNRSSAPRPTLQLGWGRHQAGPTR